MVVVLGVLVSELREDLSKGKLTTFSQTMKLRKVKGSTLRKRTEFITSYGFQKMKVEFQKEFHILLNVAVNGNI